MIGRSASFTPANSPSRINATVAIKSDSLVFDLEDSVSPEEKDSARILLREALKSLDFLKGRSVLIRVNDPATDLFADDINEIVPLGRFPLIIPKASETAIYEANIRLDALEAKFGLKNKTPLIALIETPQGVESVNDILKASDRIIGVLFGAEDFTSAMGIPRTKEVSQLLYARSRISIAARVADIEALDTPFPDIDDVDGLRREALSARQLGFTGKQAIHPSQISIIHEVFSPTPDEIENARKIVAAFNEKGGTGVISVDGKMVDKPVFQRAQMLLKKSQIYVGNGAND
jgi:citrate lyase subunit beta / citryl-CoA lyase